jgi:LysR family transcriptional regulator, low CO2-responsive transcriptional regulator
MVTLRLFEETGFTPKIRMELSTNEATREAILAGLGISILSRYTFGLEPDQANLVCLDVEGFPVESHWQFVYLVGKHLSVAARAFMNFARAEAKNLLSTEFARRPR